MNCGFGKPSIAINPWGPERLDKSCGQVAQVVFECRGLKPPPLELFDLSRPPEAFRQSPADAKRKMDTAAAEWARRARKTEAVTTPA